MTVSLRGTCEVKETYQIFNLVGQLDAFSEGQFRKVVGTAIEDDAKPNNIIFNLSKIDFVDSSGLGALVQLAKKAQGNKGSVQVVANARVTQTVKMVRLEKFLSLRASLSEAIANVS